jgi:exodeoxyribonuclease V alpha subunit
MRLNTEIPPAPSMAVAMGRWARQRSGSEFLARAMEAAARAEEDGHACARLDAAAYDLAELREHPWVSDGSRVAPLVLSDGDCFLWRNWMHESHVASHILSRTGDPAIALDAAMLADLDILFDGVDPDKGARQRAAVSGIVGRRFYVLSGGPGTGKTTTVLRMLLMRQRIAQRAGEPCAIAMAAPTGKAAQRLSQSVRKGADDLRRALGANGRDWEAALATLPDAAQTLHRLLKSLPRDDRFGHDATNPLPHDLVVVDEASMVDLGLMRALLDALKPGATLILIGDPDQLVSVSAGSVLADLVASAADGPLAPQHGHLEFVWRAAGELWKAYEVVRAGDRAALDALLQHPSVGAGWHAVDDAAALGRRLHAWMQRPEWTALDDLVEQPDADPAIAFERVRALQLLTALRDGHFGAVDINRWMDEQRRRRHDRAQWYPGRPVMVRNNDYNRRLFNGDIGLALWHQGRLQVCFETTDIEGKLHYRYLLPYELPEHDLGYALTIHKSQGSEYDHVAVLLPPDADNRILSRQLLYTGVSRAKRSLEIWSGEASLNAALARLSQRNGGLRKRLTER